MTFISSHQDPEALSLTFVAEFDASVERVWQVWEDPRQLERWWGPPTYPATFQRHEFVPGGSANYYMTSPEGEKFHGWWKITAIDAPRRLEYDDGFADENGVPDDKMGATHSVMTLETVEGRTRMTTVTVFESAEQLQQMLEMGMEEGVREGMGQIDALLAEPARA
ncbi:SRPBCC domain-containing protein [Arthrobacter frigidicola]|uniref:SRPBCC family protein n=1 Tax=Arthrobacter zhaoguopingii TaxID=2681491 RepID=UPI000E7360D5|nr:SRPBCC domain-containing protein [Arthrobacter zhaoguopingii]RJU00896.1 SRPBCC domain-containing protein [Arthrobacter frigidicola]